MDKANAELADVINLFQSRLIAKHKLPRHHLRTLDAINKCRTEYMGGRVEACETCGNTHTLYNSCRNRHCPKCGTIEKERWIELRKADLLSVRYFHVVFTVPDSLNEIFMLNQVVMYNQLFRTVWDVMNSFGQTRHWLNGQLGMTAILHTWGQNLSYHPHLHLIVPAGALVLGKKWKHARSRGKFLFDVKQLSKVFQARFVEAIRELYAQGIIKQDIPLTLFNKKWVVYAKKAFGGPKQVIEYLGRYTHRVAISNNRIKAVDEDTVTFTWKDYSQDYKQQTTTLRGEEFLRLFCLHILPVGFTRIRHYGFLSSASKSKKLPLIRALLGDKTVYQKSKDWKELLFRKMGIKLDSCKCCGGKMKAIENIPDRFHRPQRAPPINPTKRVCVVFQ